MLDAFLSTLVERDKCASAEDEMTERFKQLPLEEVTKIASGKVKLSYHDDEGNCWLKKYEGTPLYDQAISLEEECIQIESDDIERRMQRRQEDDRTDSWDTKDMLRLKKRQLDLELNKLRATGESPPSGETGDDEEGTEALSADDAPQEAKVGSAQESKLKRAGDFGKKALRVAKAAQEIGVKTAQPVSLSEEMEGGEAGGRLLGSVAGGGLGALAGAKRGSGVGGRLAGAGIGALGGAVGGNIVGGQVGRGIAGPAAIIRQGAQLPTKEAEVNFIDLAGRSMAHAMYKEGQEDAPEEAPAGRVRVDPTTKMWGPPSVRKGGAIGALTGAGLGALGGAAATGGGGAAGRVAGGAMGALGGAALGGGIGSVIGAGQLTEEEKIRQQQAIMPQDMGAMGGGTDAGMRVRIQNRPTGMAPDEAAQDYADDIMLQKQLGGATGGGLAGGLLGGAAGAGLGGAVAGERGAVLGGTLGVGAGMAGGGYLGQAVGKKSGERKGKEMKQRALTKASSAMVAWVKAAERTWGQAIGDHFAGGLSPSWATQRQLDRQTKAAKQPAAQPVAAAPQMPKAAEVEKQSFLAGALMGGAIGGKGAAEKQTQENQMQQAGIGLTSPQKVKHGLRGAAIKMNPLAPKVAAMAPGGEQWGQQDTDAAKQLAGTAGRSMVEAIPGTAAVKAIGSALYGSKKPAATPGVPPPPKVASAMKYAASRVGISPLAP